jgi:hypothetical protein
MVVRPFIVTTGVHRVPISFILAKIEFFKKW